MSGYNIAQFFAKLSFQVDTKNLDAFERNLKGIEHRIMELDKRLTGKFNQIQKGLASTQLARKRQLDIDLKEVKINNEKMKGGMKFLALKEKEIKLGAKKAKQDKIDLGLFRTTSALWAQKAREQKAELAKTQSGIDRGMAFGPSRQTMHSLRDSYDMRVQRQERAEALRSARERVKHEREANKLAKQTLADRNRQIREEAAARRRDESNAARFAWRSRRRVQDVGIAETMAYEAEARRNSWRRQGGGGRFRMGMGAGVGAGMMSLGRGFIPGLGAAFALSQTNRISQELIGQQIAMNAVTGSPATGDSSMRWIKAYSQKLGISYRDVTPSYTKMLASGLNSGFSEDQVRETFKGLSEYGRVLNLDPERMKLSMRAVEQMMNKQSVMSEELKQQWTIV